MLIAEVICSDEDCAAETDLVAESADAFEKAVCDCGCTFVVLAVSGWTRPEARVLALAAA